MSKDNEHIHRVLKEPSVGLKAKRYDRMVKELKEILANDKEDYYYREICKTFLSGLEGEDNDN